MVEHPSIGNPYTAPTRALKNRPVNGKLIRNNPIETKSKSGLRLNMLGNDEHFVFLHE